MQVREVLGWIARIREEGFQDRYGLSVEPISREGCNSIIICRVKSNRGAGLGRRRRGFCGRGRARRTEGTGKVLQK
jgi:hypothetical protein